LERIREAIKLAKKTRNVTGAPNVLGPRPVIHPTNPNYAAPLPDAAPETMAPALHVAKTNAKHLEEHRIVGHLSDNAATIPFEILRTKIVQEMGTQNWSVLVVTSPTQGCGKTVTAINLALSMAKLQGRAVYLLDLDFRKPSISKYLGLARQPALNDYLYGEKSAAETLFNIDLAGENLMLGCNWEASQHPAEAMASRQLAEYFAFLKTRQDQAIIIVDLPPLLVSDDVISVLPLADCCVLTVAENLTTTHDIGKCEELLSSTNFLGCVYNKSREANKNQYYY
jgi:protein-tyrosine kinase